MNQKYPTYRTFIFARTTRAIQSEFSLYCLAIPWTKRVGFPPVVVACRRPISSRNPHETFVGFTVGTPTVCAVSTRKTLSRIVVAHVVVAQNACVDLACRIGLVIPEQSHLLVFGWLQKNEHILSLPCRGESVLVRSFNASTFFTKVC